MTSDQGFSRAKKSNQNPIILSNPWIKLLLMVHFGEITFLLLHENILWILKYGQEYHLLNQVLITCGLNALSQYSISFKFVYVCIIPRSTNQIQNTIMIYLLIKYINRNNLSSWIFKPEVRQIFRFGYFFRWHIRWYKLIEFVLPFSLTQTSISQKYFLSKFC